MLSGLVTHCDWIVFPCIIYGPTWMQYLTAYNYPSNSNWALLMRERVCMFVLLQHFAIHFLGLHLLGSTGLPNREWCRSMANTGHEPRNRLHSLWVHVLVCRRRPNSNDQHENRDCREHGPVSSRMETERVVKMLILVKRLKASSRWISTDQMKGWMTFLRLRSSRLELYMTCKECQYTSHYFVITVQQTG